MSGPRQLTPGALESLLAEADGDTFPAFVAALYERTGREVDRQGRHLATVTPDGDRERLLVWTDDRGRIARLLGVDSPDPDVEDAIDAVVTRKRDAASAARVAGAAGADLRDTDDLHDRLLYAMDREACRDLCREQFDREVEPRPAPEAGSGGIGLDALSRPRIALIAVAICALLVAGAAGLPGSGPSDGDVFVPGNGSGTAAPPGAGPVTPIGGAPGGEPPADETPPQSTIDTPPPTVRTPPLPSPAEPELLEPCPDDDPGGGLVRICLPPRPFSAEHRPDITAGTTTASLYATFGNPYDSEIRRASLRIEAPPGWETRPVITSPVENFTRNHVLIGRLGPEESRNVSWVVTPPGTADGGRYNVTVVSEWAVPGYESPDFVDNASTNATGNYFRVEKNYTYRVRPAECRGVEPCSLLANDTAGSEPFGVGTLFENTTNTTAGYLYNPHDQTITNGTVTLEPPNAEWNVTPVNGTTFESLASGESQPVAWNLTPPDINCRRTYTLQGTATYELDGGDRVTVPFSLDVAVDFTGICFQ